MTGRNIWAAVVVACSAMLIVAIMAIAHVDKDTIFLVASVLATPVLAALVVGQQAQTQATTAAIASQTNGTQTRMLQMLEAQGQMLAQMNLPPTKAATIPEAASSPPVGPPP